MKSPLAELPVQFEEVIQQLNAQAQYITEHVQDCEGIKKLQKHAKSIEKNIKKKAKAMEKEAKKASKQIEKEAKKEAKKIEKEAKKIAKTIQKEAMKAVGAEVTEEVELSEVADELIAEVDLQETQQQKPRTMLDHMAEMGVQEEDLTVSMFTEIEQVVNAEAEAAKAEAEAKAAAAEDALQKLKSSAEAYESEKADLEQQLSEMATIQADIEAAEAEHAADKAEAEAEASAAEEACKAEESRTTEEEKHKAEEAAEEICKPADNVEEIDPMVEQLMGMGFTHEMAANALEASNRDIDAAISMIINSSDATWAQSVAEPEPEAELVWREEWEALLDELKDMGFEGEITNRE